MSRCMVCGKEPREIEQYIDAVIQCKATSPEAYVLEHESTYIPKTERFVCPGCYVQAVAALQVWEALQEGEP